ncbi:MAG: hypothetical protein WEE64_08200 [Dehalococcoidia bacterium]
MRKAVPLTASAALLAALALFGARLLWQEAPPAPEAREAPLGTTKSA